MTVKSQNMKTIEFKRSLKYVYNNQRHTRNYGMCENVQHTREKGNQIHSEKKSISYAHWH